MPVDIASPQTYLYVTVAVLTLVLPGMALYLLAHQLRLLRIRAPRNYPDSNATPSPNLDLADALLCSPALGIAFWPLLLLYLTLVGLRLSVPLLLAILTAAALYIVGVLIARLSVRAQLRRHAIHAQMHMHASTRATDLPSGSAHSEAGPSSDGVRGTRIAAHALPGMALLALAFRLGDIQGLVVPMFGDSLHHTMITTLIAGSGQVPSGYAPYVPVNTFTYHFGFHTLAAVLSLLTSAPATHAVLFTGQVLIVMALPVAGLLNLRLFNSWYAGLGAALLTGFVSLMPAYYVNWGRYTQLAGNVLLVVALALLVRTMGPRWNWALMALATLCVAGLTVVHYRILIFLGLFGPALAIAQLFAAWWAGRSLQDVWAAWARGLLVIVGGVVLALPWWLNLWANYFPQLAGRLQTVTPDYLAAYNDPQVIAYFAGRFLPAIAVMGVILCVIPQVAIAMRSRFNPTATAATETTHRAGAGLAQRRWQPELESKTMMCAAVAIWAILLVLSLWVVPGAIGSYTVAITLYIPLSALGGYALGWAVETLMVHAGRKVKAQPVALAVVALAGAFSFAFGTWHLIDPGRYQYVHAPDLQAFEWIRNNTPATARFLISAEFSYAGRGVTATDAGMWLPLLAGRNVSVPALSAWMEKPADPQFFTVTRTLAAYTQPLTGFQSQDPSTQQVLRQAGVISATHTLSDPETLSLMRSLGITHVYVGAAMGNSKPRLDVQTMRTDSHHYRLVYSMQGVYIFEVVYQAN